MDSTKLTLAWQGMTTMNKARLLILIGFVIGLKSLWMSVDHIGDSHFVLIESFNKGASHAWYHVFREVFGDVSAMVVIGLIFFLPSMERSPTTWWVCLILMLGYYLPFWAGAPFMSELAAPHWRAELVHLSMAVPALSGLWLARKEFFAGWDD